MTTAACHIMVINSGSSSLKFSLFDVRSEPVVATGIAERLGTVEAVLKFSGNDSEKMEEPIPSADHRSALRRVINRLSIGAIKEVDAFGHRIVHGGEYFRKPVLIDDEVLKRIEALSDLAPLHNPPGAQGIRVASELFPNRPQVAVFDTAFHQTLPRMHFTTRFRRSFTLSIMSAVMGFTEQAFNTLPMSWPGGFVGRLKNSK